MTAGGLDGHVAIVTGGGRGIGRAIVEKLASAGVAVVVNDLTDVAEEAVCAVVDCGGRAVAHIGDVTDVDAPRAMVQTALENFGGIDIVVNNAGYSTYAAAHEMADDLWTPMLDVLLTAPFRLVREAAPHLFGDDGRIRRIVNISSVGGINGSPGGIGYASAKAGVLGMTKTLAKEFGPRGVTVNAVAPGLIRTRLTEGKAAGTESISVGDRDYPLVEVPMDDLVDQVPLRRLGTPEDVAGAVYLLCLPESDYISGETIVVGGGWMP